MRLTGWKKVFPGDHIEEMRGSFAQNDRYCSKQSSLIEFGERPLHNGQRRDLNDLCVIVKQAAEAGQDLSEVVTEEGNAATFVQFNSGVTKLYNMAITAKLRRIDKNFAPDVYYVYGAPGTGKTRWVREQEPEVYDCPSADGYKWKCGYAGHEAVVYDNVTPENLTHPESMLKEIDRYFIQVPIKGGYVGWRPRRIYITSVFKPCQLANLGKFTVEKEFLRRLTHLVNMDEHKGVTIERVQKHTSADP
jgi:hypothetical protein